MATESAPKEQLEYFLSVKEPFLVIAFMGVIGKDAAAVFEKCLAEILKSPSQKIVISLHDVNQIALNGLPALTRFQALLRQKPGQIRVCYLRPNLLTMLKDRAAVRPEEVVPNLKAALDSLGTAS